MKSFDQRLSEALGESPFDPNSDPQSDQNRFRLLSMPKPGELRIVDPTKFKDQPRIISIDTTRDQPVALISEPFSDPGKRRKPGVMFVYEGPEGVWSGFSVADREMVVGRLPVSDEELADLDDVYFYPTTKVKTGKFVKGIPQG